MSYSHNYFNKFIEISNDKVKGIEAYDAGLILYMYLLRKAVQKK
ncbi:hypothetical protein [Wolbachia endosymbiont of Bemisia tabaci]|nr:hypothetical protein [Wolbachia endosymbiont of Bemisia tabaci]